MNRNSSILYEPGKKLAVLHFMILKIKMISALYDKILMVVMKVFEFDWEWTHEEVSSNWHMSSLNQKIFCHV